MGMKKAGEVLQKYFGYAQFRENQIPVIENILKRKDTLAIMPTGAGKSVCYQVPALIFEGITIVISPLISLMKDQVDILEANGISAVLINSSLKVSEYRKAKDVIRSGKAKILYVAPERLESEDFIELINECKISMVTVDEAHCVSQWGHDFRPSYTRIEAFISHLKERPIVTAFTATATEEVEKDIKAHLGFKHVNTFRSSVNRKNLKLNVLKQSAKKFLLEYLDKNRDSSGIVYFITRKEVDSYFEFLSSQGISVGRYHAGMSDKERVISQEAFQKDDIKVILGTNAFGMGIDKSNIRFVIHANIPKDLESYYQEIGRAGRDGENSECYLLFQPKDIMMHKYMISEDRSSLEHKKIKYDKLNIMVNYAHTQQCLSNTIMKYFGESPKSPRCESCINCLADYEEIDYTIEAQKIISCIGKIKMKYGSKMIADILKGSKQKKILQLQLDKQSTYGIMSEYSVEKISEIINFLISDGYIDVESGTFPTLSLSNRALEFIKKRESYSIKTKEAKKNSTVDEFSEGLFNRLRKLRYDLATRRNLAPYMVFSDATLRLMAQNRPKNEEEFLNISGVGKKKLEMYGKDFLSELNQ